MRDTLKKEMNRRYKSQADFSKESGVSTGAITNFFKYHKGDLEVSLKIVRALLPEHEKEFMLQYFQEVESQNLRYCMEYASTHRYLDELKVLIERAEKGNPLDRQWAEVYGIKLEGQRAYYQLAHPAYIRELRGVKTSCSELNLLLLFMETYSYYYRKEYMLVVELAEHIKKSIKNLKEGYIRRSFQTRLYEMLATIELKYKKQPIKARYYCEKILENNIGVPYQGNAYFLIGLSYLYSDFDECVRYYRLSKEAYDFIGRKVVSLDLQNQIEMAHVIHNRYCEFKSTFHQSLYRYMNDLGEVDLEEFETEENLPYILYFRGMKNSDVQNLLRSLNIFATQKDLCRSELPKRALENIGYSPDLLKEMTEYHLVTLKGVRK